MGTTICDTKDVHEIRAQSLGVRLWVDDVLHVGGMGSDCIRDGQLQALEGAFLHVFQHTCSDKF